MKYLAIPALLLLFGCTSITATTSTTPAQANSIAAASNLYLAAAGVADAYLKSGKATAPQKAEIAALSKDVSAALDAGLAAQVAGNSPAVATALASFNEAEPAFTAYLATLGLKP